MTVADLSGPWRVELKIDDAEAGHVVEAMAAAEDGLQVDFRLASAPGQDHRGRLIQLAEATDVDESGVPVLPAVVALADNEIPGRRPGATVIATIQCGRRPIGFVWFRRVIEAIQRHWPF